MKKIEHLASVIPYEHDSSFTREPSAEELVAKLNEIIDALNEIIAVQLEKENKNEEK